MSAEARFRSLVSLSLRTIPAAAAVAASILAASTVHARCRATAPAQCLKPGEIDPTFGIEQYPVFYDLGNGLSRGAMDMVVLPDGRIVMGGSSTLDGGTNHDPTLARFTARGLLDTTFGTGGVRRLDLGLGNALIQSLALQEDGKILAAGGHDADPSHVPGYTTGYVPETSFLARLEADGSLDPSFGTGGQVVISTPGFYRGYERVLVQADGKILVVGFQGSWPSPSYYFVERYDSAGVLDPTFGSGGIAVATGSGFRWTPYYRAGAALQADGKIVIGGAAFGVGPYINCALARFDETGALDATFGRGGERLVPQEPGDVCNFQAVAPQADGKILASGAFYSAGDQQAFALMRFHPDGSPDTGFGRKGRALTRIVKYSVTITSHALAVQPDGLIVQAGSAGGAEFDLTRHRANGRRDARFGRWDGPGIERTGRPGPVWTAVFDGAQAVTVLPDGKILAGGNAGHWSTFALARYLSRPCLYDPSGPTLTCD